MGDKDNITNMVQDDSCFVYYTQDKSVTLGSQVIEANVSSGSQARFNHLYDQWWRQTCMYSGRNFYISNTYFMEMLKMGKVILPFVKDKMQREPEYKQRALKWLHDAIATL